jgi:hypothetical protein
MAGLLAAALVVPSSFAQSTDDVSKDLRELKARVAALEVENSALKGANDGALLESQINALAGNVALATAAPKVTFSGEMRHRYGTEFTSGADDWGIDNLARIGFGYDIGSGISFKVSAQSTFDLGANSTLDPTLYEAYSTWCNFLGINGLWAKIGRQELAFGNQFAYGVDDWNAGTSSDLMNFGYGTESFSANLVYDLNSGTGADHDQNYILYVAIKSLKDMTLEVYYSSNDNNVSADAGDRYGAHFATAFGGLGVDANLDVQEEVVGSNDDSAALEVNFDYDMNKDLGLWGRFSCAEDGYAFTGNRHSNTGYRARYGVADYYNLNDATIFQVGGNMACGSGWTAGATVGFYTADTDSANTGTEIDVWAEHACADNATMGAGLAFVSPDVGDNFTALYVQARIAF